MPIQFDQTTSGVLTMKAATSGTWSTAFPTTYGSSSNLLGTDGTNLSWIAQPGITGFASGISTSSPNATNNVVYLKPTSAGAVVFAPKGAGGISLRIPDSTATGGNVRGSYSTDLSLSGSSATDVASGAYSVAVGNSVMAAGAYSVAVGNGAKTSSDYSVSIGGATIPSSSDYAVVLSGSTVSRSGNMAYSTSINGKSLASGQYSTYLGGVGNGYDAGTAGSFVYPNAGPVLGSSDTTDSVARVVRLILGVDTSDATPTVMYTDAATATGNGYIKILNNSSVAFMLSVVCGVKSSGGNCGYWVVYGSAKNNSGTITVNCTPGAITGSAGFAPTLAVAADNTNGAIQITVTGIAATNIRWAANILMTMLTY